MVCMGFPRMTDEERHWLEEYLKTIRNLCDTALLILEHDDRLIHTTLELMHVETQRLIDDYCIKEE